MKTLDEVIMCLEGCGHIDCDDCPYHHEDEKIEVDDCAQSYKDALHYLREYRKQMTDPDGDHQQLEKARKLIQDFYRNEPLSWDELKTMEGKPVWVEWSEVIIGDYFQFHGWFLVEWINDNENEIIMQNKYGKRMIRHKNDNDWQAYRKERS